LQEGDHVRYWHDVEFHKVVATRDHEELSGRIVAVNPERGEVVVADSQGEQHVLGVPEAIERGSLTLNLQPAELIDLRKNDMVEVTYDDPQGGRPVVSTLFASRHARADRWAIVIGCERFEDQFLSRLDYTIDGAMLLRDALAGRYAVEPDRLEVLYDKTGDEMKRAITDVCQAANADTQVIVYVASHAYVDDQGRTFIAGRDFNWDQMAETGLPLDWLVNQLDQCNSQDKLLLLDCSHAGTATDLEKQPSTEEMLRSLAKPPASTAAIASCSEGQRGRRMPMSDHGVFAHFLALAYSGRADADRDLHLSVEELFGYLQREMRELNLAGEAQTPALVRPR
ncbi:MAG: caspase family protein, partial [Planctomycetaceae bacterium]